MKTTNLFIQQPYATMIVRGLRNAIPDEHFSRGQHIYINASVPVFNPNTPLEWLQEVINHQLFGNLPPTEDLPYGKCVGFVDVLCQADGNESRWTKTQEPTVIVTNAHVFDEPQSIMPRGWYDAEDIPSHQFGERSVMIWRHFDELCVPVNEKLYDIASQGGSVTFEMTGSLAVDTLLDNGEDQMFEKFTLSCGQRSKSFLWNDDCDVVWEQDPETDDLVLYPSVYAASGKAPRARLQLSCRYPLID